MMPRRGRLLRAFRLRVAVKAVTRRPPPARCRRRGGVQGPRRRGAYELGSAGASVAWRLAGITRAVRPPARHCPPSAQWDFWSVRRRDAGNPRIAGTSHNATGRPAAPRRARPVSRPPRAPTAMLARSRAPQASVARATTTGAPTSRATRRRAAAGRRSGMLAAARLSALAGGCGGVARLLALALLLAGRLLEAFLILARHARRRRRRHSPRRRRRGLGRQQRRHNGAGDARLGRRNRRRDPRRRHALPAALRRRAVVLRRSNGLRGVAILRLRLRSVRARRASAHRVNPGVCAARGDAPGRTAAAGHTAAAAGTAADTAAAAAAARSAAAAAARGLAPAARAPAQRWGTPRTSAPRRRRGRAGPRVSGGEGSGNRLRPRGVARHAPRPWAAAPPPARGRAPAAGTG